MKKLIGNPFFLLLGMIIAFIDGVVNLVLIGKSILTEIPFKLCLENTLENLISISFFVIRIPFKVLGNKNIWVRIISESIIIALLMFKPSGLLVLAGIWVSAVVIPAIVIVLGGDPYAEVEFELDALEAVPSKSFQEAGVVS